MDEATRDRRRANHKAWRAKNPDRIAAYARAHRAANADTLRANSRAWAAANPGRMKALQARWAAENPAAARAKVAKRRAARTQRTPTWFGELDELVMIEAHDLARLRGGWHVDHKYPLQGKQVSGLHVWNNVQVIPAEANRAKCNKWSPA